MKIEIPKQNEEIKDIFDYEFDKSLYRLVQSIESSPLIYNSIEGQIDPTQLNWGELLIGKSNSVFKASDEGIQLGNTSFNSAPFSVDMEGSVKIGTDTNNQLLWNNTSLIVKGSIRPPMQAADTLISSADTDVAVTQTSYGIEKQITVQASGTLRISMDLFPGGTWIKGKIYRNDVAVGTENQVTQPTGYTTFSEDIGGWSVGDKVQLYAYVDSGQGQTRNFRIYGSVVETSVDIN